MKENARYQRMRPVAPRLREGRAGDKGEREQQQAGRAEAKTQESERIGVIGRIARDDPAGRPDEHEKKRGEAIEQRGRGHAAE